MPSPSSAPPLATLRHPPTHPPTPQYHARHRVTTASSAVTRRSRWRASDIALRPTPACALACHSARYRRARHGRHVPKPAGGSQLPPVKSSALPYKARCRRPASASVIRRSEWHPATDHAALTTSPRPSQSFSGTLASPESAIFWYSRRSECLKKCRVRAVSCT